MTADQRTNVISAIDEWYARAPGNSDLQETIDWVQDNSNIPCPQCGEWLWVIKGQNAGGRGEYHLALCQNPECDFQAAD